LILIKSRQIAHQPILKAAHLSFQLIVKWTGSNSASPAISCVGLPHPRLSMASDAATSAEAEAIVLSFSFGVDLSVADKAELARQMQGKI
jgi:hypothetical protein